MIEKLYFMPNLQGTYTSLRDFYLFSINPELSDLGYFDRLFIRNNNSLIIIDVGKNSKVIGAIEIIHRPEIIFYNIPFPQTQFLLLESTLSLTTKEHIQNKNNMYCPLKLEVFSDAVVITIGQKPSYGPYFLIHEKNQLAVLVDDKLVVNAIVVLNITPEEMAELTKFHLQNVSITSYKEQKIELKELITMENKNFLIQKIIELKNVNNWHVLYYAYQRTLIDDDFLIDYAIELLSQNPTNDPKILELAGLLDSEKGQAEKIFENFVRKEDKEKILYAESPFYNKIWFYLILATDMCSEKIIA